MYNNKDSDDHPFLCMSIKGVGNDADSIGELSTRLLAFTTMHIRESRSKTGRNLGGCNASWQRTTLFALTDIQPRSPSARRRRFTVIISPS